MNAILSMMMTVSLASNASFRGNPAHTGVFETAPLTELTSLWWMTESDLPFASPAISDSLVFISAQGGDGIFSDREFSHVYAIHRSFGTIRWWMEFPSSYISNTSVAGDVLFVGCDSYLYAIDPTLAQVIWEYDVRGDVAIAPLVIEDVVLASTSAGMLYSIEMSSGNLVWSFNTNSRISSAPSTDGSTVYICDEDGAIYSVDIETGTELWHIDTFVGITSTPAIAWGNLYVTGKDGLYSIDASSGDIEWSFNVDFYTNSSPAVSDSMVYFGDHSHYMYAIDANREWANWRYQAIGADVYSPIIAGDVIYFGDSEGYFYALDKRTGDELWRYWVGHTINSSPVIQEGVVYFCANANDGGILYALR